MSRRVSRRVSRQMSRRVSRQKSCPTSRQDKSNLTTDEESPTLEHCEAAPVNPLPISRPQIFRRTQSTPVSSRPHARSVPLVEDALARDPCKRLPLRRCASVKRGCTRLRSVARRTHSRSSAGVAALPTCTPRTKTLFRPGTLLGGGAPHRWALLVRARRTLRQNRNTPRPTCARWPGFTHALYAADANRPVEIWAAEEVARVTLSRRLGLRPRARPQQCRLRVGRRPSRCRQRSSPPPCSCTKMGQAALEPVVRCKQPGSGEAAFRYDMTDGGRRLLLIDDSCTYALSAGSIARNCWPPVAWCMDNFAAAEATSSK